MRIVLPPLLLPCKDKNILKLLCANLFKLKERTVFLFPTLIHLRNVNEMQNYKNLRLYFNIKLT